MSVIQLPANKKFFVYEDKWVHGGNKGSNLSVNRSCLLNGAGNSCCVGHFLRDCGVNINRLQDKAYIGNAIAHHIIPEEFRSWDDKCVESILLKNVPKCVRKVYGNKFSIYGVNDLSAISLPVRKAMLRELFRLQFDVQLIFKKTAIPRAA